MIPYNLTLERSYPTPYSTSSLLYVMLLSMSNQRHTPVTTDNFVEDYDYIVVGGGVAGSVLASRLSEKECVTVLLLEAGKEPPKVTDIPVIAKSFLKTDIDWDYSTAPQEHAGAGHINRSIAWPGGKTIGGSSIINGMMSVRGNKKNYDYWAENGAEGWSYEEVLPYFKKLENNVNWEYIANGYHGVNGPVTTTRPKYYPELQAAIFRAGLSLGYDVLDSNGPKQTGFFDYQAAIRDGQRCSAAKAYLVPVDHRPNLHIVQQAFVKKIIIENNSAVGVKFDFRGQERNVRARREVILTAGTINSAQLLMLSGIGPKEELEKHKIQVVADLPVGKILKDHWATILNYEIDERFTPFGEKMKDVSNIWTYINTKTGVLTSTEGTIVLAFLNKDGPNSTYDFGDYQLYFVEGDTEVPEKLLRIKPEYFEAIYGPYKEKPFYMCLIDVLHPKGRGRVTLQSANPYDPPVIDPKYYSHPDDLAGVVAGMKKCKVVAETEEMKSIGTKPFTTIMPGCEKFLKDEDKYLRCYATSIVMHMNHQVASVRMGDPEDDSVVVDPQLRVKSVRNLRVADASVMPFVPSGNTMIPTLMVAEKASDLIKENIVCGDDIWDTNFK